MGSQWCGGFRDSLRLTDDQPKSTDHTTKLHVQPESGRVNQDTHYKDNHKVGGGLCLAIPRDIA